MSTYLQAVVNRLNSLDPGQAEKEFLKCCGSGEWAKRMIVERPFEDFDDLIARADQVWGLLEPRDWLEAFRSHPKIGEHKTEQQISSEAQAWSEQEQAGTRNSARETMEALVELNFKYEEKFGYIFIVCASGKTSDEMLALLRNRLENDPDEEMRNAAAEQAKITQLRLQKLMTI